MIRGPRASRLYTEWFPPKPGGRGTVIFVHGLCLTEAVWHYQKERLAGAGFGMVTWDLPGHGHSTPIAPGELTQDLALDALHRVVEEYADDSGAILVGHSLGGVLTLGYAGRRPGAAEAIRGMVLVSTPMMHFARAVAGRWPGATLESRLWGRVLSSVVESTIIERLLAKDVGKAEATRLSYRVIRVGFGKQPSPSQIRFIRDVIASVPPQVRADAFRTMSGYDVRPSLPDIRTPTLVVIGERDRLVNPDESRELARRLPEAEALTLPDVGHAAFLEVPNRFNRAIRRFAAGCLTRDRRSGAGSA